MIIPIRQESTWVIDVSYQNVRQKKQFWADLFPFTVCMTPLEPAASVQLRQIPDVRPVYHFKTFFK